MTDFWDRFLSGYGPTLGIVLLTFLFVAWLGYVKFHVGLL